MTRFDFMASESPNASLIPGYRIVPLIGRGGMGAVYRAVKESINKEVAIKVLRAGLDASEEATEQFDLEITLAARLRHRNIITVFDS